MRKTQQWIKIYKNWQNDPRWMECDESNEKHRVHSQVKNIERTLRTCTGGTSKILMPLGGYRRGLFSLNLSPFLESLVTSIWSLLWKGRSIAMDLLCPKTSRLARAGFSSPSLTSQPRWSLPWRRPKPLASLKSSRMEKTLYWERLAIQRVTNLNRVSKKYFSQILSPCTMSSPTHLEGSKVFSDLGQGSTPRGAPACLPWWPRSHSLAI